MSAQRDFLSGALPPGTRLGVWQIEHLIDRGGAGEVYAAVRADGTFRQRAALKLLQHGAVAEASRFARKTGYGPPAKRCSTLPLGTEWL